MALEFYLSRPEMLALLLTTKASEFFGLDNERLIPETQSEQREFTLQGLAMLEQRQLLTRENGNYVMNGDLALMGGALAYPTVFTLITRDALGEGQQQFLHYRLDPVNVELTMPNENEYRLAAMKDEVVALERVREILTVSMVPHATHARLEVAQADFLRAKELAERGDIQEATTMLLAEGTAPETAEQFVETLQHATVGGNVVYMRVDDNVVANVRELALVQDEQNTWLIRAHASDNEMLVIETVTPIEYSAALLDALRGVIEPIVVA